jgi:hypothetical protein
MNESSKLIPVEGVSKKLKAIVIILTVLTLFAFVALFTKLASKQPTPKKTVPVVHEPNSTPLLINEYKAVGTRLMNAGLNQQAIDQFIKVWEMQKIGSLERSQAAQSVGRLYADLNNCQEALVWLFRSEVSHSDTTQSPLIDTCLAKVRSNNPGQ